MASVIAGPAVRAAVADPYLRALRDAMLTTWHAHELYTATDDQGVECHATILDAFASLEVAFRMHDPKRFIRRSLENVDAADEPRISDLKTKLLALPQWTTDTSDVT